MPYIIILFIFFSFSNCYASDFFAPNIYTSNNITLSYNLRQGIIILNLQTQKNTAFYHIMITPHF